MRWLVLSAAGLLAACVARSAEPIEIDVEGTEKERGTSLSGAAALPPEPERVMDPDDRDAQPAVRIAPSGFERCLDGKPKGTREVVSVIFDVTEAGRVTNVEVLESTDDCFDRPVVRAVEKWRYAPKVVDGEAVPRLGVRTSIKFDLG